jgi:hypothetical protein
MNQKSFSFLAVIFIVLGAVGAMGYVYSQKKSINQKPNSSLPTDIALPPDPGEAGKVTLEGIDSDGDGVRDDIQRYIALTYPDSERTRTALIQYTKVIQFTLLDADNSEVSTVHARERERAIDCLYYINPDKANVIHSQLRARILNTDIRSRAYIISDGHLGERTFLLPSEDEMKSSCNFDPDTMRN